MRHREIGGRIDRRRGAGAAEVKAKGGPRAGVGERAALGHGHRHRDAAEAKADVAEELAAGGQNLVLVARLHRYHSCQNRSAIRDSGAL